ncbi:OLC1v1021517C1 [Oldenlandia corymbosa var. corymbosa]|uniref:RING-type E3 ubiquitin transferase n=1 Tax=Oldenlandia corymbosa var. corymbosa TaxID=529605 RepID=A0AAV1BY43_OLDCO|nr:OLC1v1021517C1 [Oldenlandia corymbosa var. corymbosa]
MASSSSSTSSPPPSHLNPVNRNRFTPRIFLPAGWLQHFHKVHITAFHLLILLFLICPTTIAAAETKNHRNSYSLYCNDVVPESPSSPTPLTDPIVLTIWHAQFTDSAGRTQITPSRVTSPNQVFFRSSRAYKTPNDGVFKFDAAITLRRYRFPGHPLNTTRRGLRLVHYRPPRIPVDSSYYRSGSHDFTLSGFWNSTSGKLCMVGSGFEGRYGSLFSVFKLHYPDKSDIFNTFINGTLDIYNAGGDHVETLVILGVNLRNYEFQLISKAMEENSFQPCDNVSNVSLTLERANELCLLIHKAGVFELEYKDDCDRVNCDILQSGRSNVTLPSSVFFNEVECWESGFVRYLLGFMSNGARSNFNPNATVTAEGKWEHDKRRLDMVACRMLDGKGTVGDCSIRLSLRLPMFYNLRGRDFIVGEIWSSRRQDETGYFGRVKFRSRINRDLRHDGVQYEYTEIEKVKQSYAQKMITRGKGGNFPEATSRDMRFNMLVRTQNGHVFGFASPLFVDDKSFTPDGVFGQVESRGRHIKKSPSNLVNISYELSFRPLDGLNITELPQFSSVRISAEGIYNSKTGQLYMVGCMRVPVPYAKFGRNASLDCEIFVEMQYPPLEAKGGSTIKGTIKSTRMKSDPLYFEPLQISSHSLYYNQVKESIWRMDLEMTMVLVSNTLACIFVGLQLYYVQKHPEMLPFISIIMLTVLTLAHMIPLLLNFEALFLSNRKQNVYLGTDGWIEVNEVLVRVITMVAFLLEFRLLQLTWSAKTKIEGQKSLWISEKKVLFLCLPLYLGGGLIAWFAHLASKPHGRTLMVLRPVLQQRQSFWGGFKAYAGLIRDGFLIPQILFNSFCDNKERSLAPSFYLGTSLVRMLPHVYDLYRAHSSTFSVRMIYGNPKMDYYSTAWDIVICILGFLFAFLIYLQQRFGGRCFLPKRFKQNIVYEKVPVVGIDT